MDMLYALVRLFKPELMLDTGTHLGLSTQRWRSLPSRMVWVG